MAEYIERDKAIHAARYTTPMMPSQSLAIVNAIESIPAADVRPVVQCKECKHYKQLDLFRNSPVWSGMCHYWNSHATCEDGFCFKAAKKEES